MSKGWYGNKMCHSLASRGIRITEEIKKEVTKCKIRPYDINCGSCEDFAINIVEKINGAEEIWLEDMFPDDKILSNVSHCVILYNGKYYDSENPEGVESPYDLEIVKNVGKEEYHKRMQGIK